MSGLSKEVGEGAVTWDAQQLMHSTVANSLTHSFVRSTTICQVSTVRQSRARS